MSYSRCHGHVVSHPASSSQLVRSCLKSQRLSLEARAQRDPRRGNTRVADDPYFDSRRAAPDYPPSSYGSSSSNYTGGNGGRQTQWGEPPRGPPPGGNNNGGGGEWRNRALLAGAFFLGIGAGVWFTEDVNLYPNNVASTELVDRRTPNSEVCMSNGYSAMVFDQRLFVSFNPFNVYVTQPEIKPGCVLRRSNYNVLESRKLVSRDETESCKRGMNTFAFVGDLDKSPEVSCVYHSEQAENQYLQNPQRARMGDGQRPPAAEAPPDLPP